MCRIISLLSVCVFWPIPLCFASVRKKKFRKTECAIQYLHVCVGRLFSANSSFKVYYEKFFRVSNEGCSQVRTVEVAVGDANRGQEFFLVFLLMLKNTLNTLRVKRNGRFHINKSRIPKIIL